MTMSRPVDQLKPIRPTSATGLCSRCGRQVISRGVRLGDGSLAHDFHFHAKDREGLL